MRHDFDYYLAKVFTEKFNENMEKACLGLLAASGAAMVFAAIFIW